MYAPHLDTLRKDGEIVVSKGKRKQNNMAAAQQACHIHTYMQYSTVQYSTVYFIQLFTRWYIKYKNPTVCVFNDIIHTYIE